jgi:protein ImuB
VSRVQGLLGPAGVLTARLGGGRDPASRVRLTPWGDPADLGDQKLGEKLGDSRLGDSRHRGGGRLGGSLSTRPQAQAPKSLGGETEPWPGRLPSPSPATVPVDPVPAVVADATGAPVGVDGRCAVTGEPATLSVAGGPAVRVTGWAGPWPVDERWWDGAGRRRARFQMTTDDGVARLLAIQAGRWWVEATYD